MFARLRSLFTLEVNVVCLVAAMMLFIGVIAGKSVGAGNVPPVGSDMGCTAPNQVVYYNGTALTCGAVPGAAMSGTTGSIGGGLLIVGGCTSGTATVAGATTSMTAMASPVTYPGDGVQWQAYVSAANTVTVKLCAIVALAPTASNYNVRVLQ